MARSLPLDSAALALGAGYIAQYGEYQRQAASPATPPTGLGRLYGLDDGSGDTGLWWLNESGVPVDLTAGGAGPAPANATYLVNSASAGLSNEIVVSGNNVLTNITIGSPAASAGGIRLVNAAGSRIKARNATNSGDIQIVEVDNANLTHFASSGNATFDGGDVLFDAGNVTISGNGSRRLLLGDTPATTGIIRIRNNQLIGWRDAANSANFTLGLNASNEFEFSNGAAVVPSAGGSSNLGTGVKTWQILFFESYLQTATASNPATTGNLRLPNGGVIGWRNAANSANLSAGFDSENDFVISNGQIQLGDAALTPDSSGELYRSGATLLYYNGTNSINLMENIGIIVLFLDGTLATGTKMRNYNFDAPFAGTIKSARAKCNTAPTGADLLIDINEDGTTIFTSTKLTIANGATAGSQSGIQNAAFAQGAIFTFDIDQVGSTIPGADLTIELIVSYTRTF